MRTSFIKLSFAKTIILFFSSIYCVKGLADRQFLALQNQSAKSQVGEDSKGVETHWQIGAAMTAEEGAGQFPAKLLVSIDTITIDQVHHIQYAWISALVGVNPSEMGGVPPVVDLSVVPVVLENPKSINLRLAPMAYERHIDLGNKGSVVIQPIGFQGELSSETGSALVKGFVDIVGLKYMAVADNPEFWGVQGASVGFTSHISWDVISNSTAIVFSPLMGVGGIAFGKLGGDMKSILVSGEVASRIAYEMKTMKNIFSVYAQGGVEGLWLTRPAPLPNDFHHELIGTVGLEVRFQ